MNNNAAFLTQPGEEPPLVSPASFQTSKKTSESLPQIEFLKEITIDIPKNNILGNRKKLKKAQKIKKHKKLISNLLFIGLLGNLGLMISQAFVGYDPTILFACTTINLALILTGPRLLSYGTQNASDPDFKAMLADELQTKEGLKPFQFIEFFEALKSNYEDLCAGNKTNFNFITSENGKPTMAEVRYNEVDGKFTILLMERRADKGNS